MTTIPASLSSPLTSRLRHGALERQTINGYAAFVPANAADPTALCLADFTHVARAGFKGRGSANWLARQGVAIPVAPNRTVVDASGCLIARLGLEDLLIIGTLDTHSERPARLMQMWRGEYDAGIRDIGYPTPKQHSHVLLHFGGVAAASVLSQLCAVDLRPHAFADDALAQTMAAGIVASFMRCDRNRVPGYLILVDTSFAEYFWDGLTDAMLGYDPGVGQVGIADAR